jgi:hypothetical protein
MTRHGRDEKATGWQRHSYESVKKEGNRWFVASAIDDANTCSEIGKRAEDFWQNARSKAGV